MVRFDEIQRLFDEARALDPDAREVFLRDIEDSGLRAELSAHLNAYLGTFGVDGHPPEADTVSFISDELALRAGPLFAAGKQVRDTCVWTPTGWRTIGGCEGRGLEGGDEEHYPCCASSGAGSEDMAQVSELDLVDAYLIHCRRD